MARPAPVDRFAYLQALTTTYHVGEHKLSVAKVQEGRWTFTVDEGPVSGSYMTQAEAWEAGIREADRIDRSVAR
jgi:hypothetical protein